MTTPDLPIDGYAETLREAVAAISAARADAALAVNRRAIRLYWRLGKVIVDRQVLQGWGAKVIERLSLDLRNAFPDMRGLSVGNLHYMRRLAEAWPEESDCLGTVGGLGWGHVQRLLDIVPDQDHRRWYAGAAIEYGWSRAVLENQVMSRLIDRVGKSPSNFSRVLPAEDSELMQQITRDPYNLDFIGLAANAAERQIELALVERIERFLRELGRGFAFVGRQYRLDVDGDEFFVDLLMFHADSNRFLCTTRRGWQNDGVDMVVPVGRGVFGLAA
jgi:predicted nuclease of restriction endonuclease-like (RecB) superfamily